MIISTRNVKSEGGSGRRIKRAQGKPNISYELDWHPSREEHTPTVHLQLMGDDGRNYHVQLTDADIRAITSARVRWAAQFASLGYPLDADGKVLSS